MSFSPISLSHSLWHILGLHCRCVLAETVSLPHATLQWGDLCEDYKMAKEGTQQSPIDLQTNLLNVNTELGCLNYEYHEAPARIVSTMCCARSSRSH